MEFDFVALPWQAQVSPVFAIAVYDVNNDTHADYSPGGNFFRTKPEAVAMYTPSKDWRDAGAMQREISTRYRSRNLGWMTRWRNTKNYSDLQVSAKSENCNGKKQ